LGTVRRSFSGWSFVAFPLAIIFVFSAVPTLIGVGLSFFEWTGGGAPRFIGLRNYRDLLADPALWPAVRNTLVFAFATVPITTVAAFLLAVVMNATWFVGKTIARTLFFLPAVVSIVAVGFIWRWVLEPSDAGLLNHVLDAIVQFGAGLFGHADAVAIDWPDWLGNTPWALAAIIAVSIWRGLGFAIVLYLAALSAVPRAHYDAAAVDGAGPWQSMWRVTWPSVRPMTFFLLITGMIGALQVFDVILVMIGSIEQPWTDVLNLFLYREFTQNRLGFAATLGVIVLALTVVVTIAQVAWLRSSQEAPA
jgi:ABC-type sugar transport system permease subunit